MWLIDWIMGFSVDLPERIADGGIAAAKDALREPVAKAEAAEAEKRRKEEDARKSRGEVRFSRGDICVDRWSIRLPPGHGAGTSPGGHVAEPPARYSIESGVIPKSVFDGNAAKAREVSAQLAAKPKYEAKKTFSEALLEHVVAKCDGSAPMAYKRSGISRQVYSRIISSMFAKVDKLTAMRLCIGLQLTEDEASEFLKTAGYAFSDAMPVDVVFAYCIRNGIFNIFDVNRLLDEMGQKTFDIVF